MMVSLKFSLTCSVLTASALLVSASKADFLAHYKGEPFHDSKYNAGPQKIPGTVLCAYYDLGGEGVAYHDSDAKNNGSGALNPANGSYLNEFRMSEGVDTSYTKSGLDPKIDDNPFDKVVPPAGLLYVGWTVPGEWFNLTVDVAATGDYSVDLLYTSNRGGAISFDVNGEPATGPLQIPSTYDAADPVAWRQWHHWNVAKDLARIHLEQGRNVMTVHTVSEGQMNYATLEFRMVAGQGAFTQNPLHRQYRAGEALAYQMHGVNGSWEYSVRADGTVKQDASGKFTEEYQWSKMQSGGQPVPLRADMSEFRQRITLDPGTMPSVPDLTKVDTKLIGPITDLMTFYVDLWLANKLGQLEKAGDHFCFRSPIPASSWADGTRVILGQSAIDFDMTLKSVDTIAGTAALEVKHVPPKAALKLPAAWMETPVGILPNNWVGVTKQSDGSYIAGVGEETVDVLVTVSLEDGKILSATMNNPVKTVERTCRDQALTECDAAKSHLIVRKVEIELVK